MMGMTDHWLGVLYMEGNKVFLSHVNDMPNYLVHAI